MAYKPSITNFSNMAQRLLNMKAVAAIMISRIGIPASKVGRTVNLTIQGNGNIVDVKNKAGEFVQSAVAEGEAFQKWIFNCKANSEIAMKNARNKAILAAGVAAEKVGNFVEADKQFSDYLNKVQLSFNVPTTSSIAEHLGNGTDIAAKIQLIKTENGELLTIDNKTIRVVEPEVLGNTVFSFDAEDTDDVEDTFGSEVEEEDKFSAMDRKALIDAVKAGKVKGLKSTSTDDEIRAALRTASIAA